MQYLNVSNQHTVHLKLHNVVNYISIKNFKPGFYYFSLELLFSLFVYLILIFIRDKTTL